MLEILKNVGKNFSKFVVFLSVSLTEQFFFLGSSFVGTFQNTRMTMFFLSVGKFGGLNFVSFPLFLPLYDHLNLDGQSSHSFTG